MITLCLTQNAVEEENVNMSLKPVDLDVNVMPNMEVCTVMKKKRSLSKIKKSQRKLPKN